MKPFRQRGRVALPRDRMTGGTQFIASAPASFSFPIIGTCPAMHVLVVLGVLAVPAKLRFTTPVRLHCALMAHLQMSKAMVSPWFGQSATKHEMPRRPTKTTMTAKTSRTRNAPAALPPTTCS